jgi:Cu/Ag efflux protein CusF
VTRGCALALAALLAIRAAAAEGGAPALFQGEGKVLAIDEKNWTVTLDHEAIPGLMPAMRMRFDVDRGVKLRGIKVGETVRFTLGNRGDAVVIVAMRRVASPVDLHQSTFFGSPAYCDRMKARIFQTSSSGMSL